MNQAQPDLEKLISIATLMRHRHHLTVQREPILLFHKETCRLVDIKDTITKYEYDHHIIHRPDLLFYIIGTPHIMEIDGAIHNTKNRVIERDKMRNEHYLLSGINYIIIDELKILHNIGIDKIRPATVAELWPVIDRRLKILIRK